MLLKNAKELAFYGEEKNQNYFFVALYRAGYRIFFDYVYI